MAYNICLNPETTPYIVIDPFYTYHFSSKINQEKFINEMKNNSIRATNINRLRILTKANYAYPDDSVMNLLIYNEIETRFTYIEERNSGKIITDLRFILQPELTYREYKSC